MRDEMRAYLDAPCNRLGTHCEKWDGLERYFGRSDLIAMWVADMDFPTVPQVKQAVVERAQHAIYGYTDNAEAEREAEAAWLLRRHGLRVEKEWMLYSPGVVDSLHFCVDALTAPGDGIVIQTPVYGPFFSSVSQFGRKIVESPLKRDGEAGWVMDYEDLERAFEGGAKMLLLCSPHNPVGRVWRREELQRLVDLANRFGVIVVADEIHAEFTFDGHRQTRILSLEGADRCVMLTSATKSFNLAGLRHSSIIVPDGKLRDALKEALARAHADMSNIFGSIAQTAAYTYGDEWMDAVVEYIRENRDYAVSFLREKLPRIGCRPQEGTYLMWLDFSALGMSHEAVMEMLVNEAHVAMNSGLFFGESGRGWFRLNLATQRANVVAALENLYNAIRSR
ncbi:MAG: PatB family C-S lyase [Clostridia bacterium]|nr:PatB family C-S lyase [Clostridia bacterium]